MTSQAPARPAVCVVVVNWNTRGLLHDCLRSLEEKVRTPHEVVVVDNASADGSAEMVRTLHPGVKLVASAENLGFVKGNNVGARHASADFLFLLNPDTVLVTDAVTGLHRLLDSDPTIGVAGCKVLNADGSVQTVCAATYPTPFNEFTSLLLLHRVFPRLLPDREMDWWDHSDSRDVECLSGACMMIRKKLWDDLGGFDERIFMYAEDLDLCRRVALAGRRVRYLASEEIVHFAGSASGKRRESFFSLMSQMSSNTYFLRKHFGAARAAAYRAAVFAGASIRLVVGAAASPVLHVLTGRSAREFLRKSAALWRWSVTGRASR